MKFGVETRFLGAEQSFDTIIATQVCYTPNGPPLLVEGDVEKFVREWLEAKGDLSTFLMGCCLTLSIGIYPEEYRWEVHLVPPITKSFQ